MAVKIEGCQSRQAGVRPRSRSARPGWPSRRPARYRWSASRSARARPRAGAGVQGPGRPGPAAAGVADRRAPGRRGMRLRPDRRVRPDPAHHQPPPEDAAGGRDHRQRAARHLGLLLACARRAGAHGRAAGSARQADPPVPAARGRGAPARPGGLPGRGRSGAGPSHSSTARHGRRSFLRAGLCRRSTGSAWP